MACDVGRVRGWSSGDQGPGLNRHCNCHSSLTFACAIHGSHGTTAATAAACRPAMRGMAAPKTGERRATRVKARIAGKLLALGPSPQFLASWHPGLLCHHPGRVGVGSVAAGGWRLLGPILFPPTLRSSFHLPFTKTVTQSAGCLLDRSMSLEHLAAVN
jgi:hypothetical protein